MELPELRYSDCPTVEVTLTIAASPDAVWALVSDIQLPARFSSEFLGADWLDGVTAPEAGASSAATVTPRSASGRRRPRSVTTSPGEGSGGRSATPTSRQPRGVSPSSLTALGRHSRSGCRWGRRAAGSTLAIDAMPEKESKILHRRLAEHQANMQATLAGIKRVVEA